MPTRAPSSSTTMGCMALRASTPGATCPYALFVKQLHSCLQARKPVIHDVVVGQGEYERPLHLAARTKRDWALPSVRNEAVLRGQERTLEIGKVELGARCEAWSLDASRETSHR